MQAWEGMLNEEGMMETGDVMEQRVFLSLPL
jgi:hypothetical protein